MAVGIALVAAGCGGSDEEPDGSAPAPTTTEAADVRPLTTDEAQRLAMMRFSNYTAGVRSVQFELRDSGQTYRVDGWVDFAAALGYAHVWEGLDGEPPTLVAWTKIGISSHDPVDGADRPPLPPPNTNGDATAWTSSELAPDASRLHAALATILLAGHDRPDNPVLLQQTDARWSHSDTVDGTPVDVLFGPTSDEPYDAATSSTAGDGSDATVRYWIDGESLLRRMELRLGGAGEWTAIDFDEADVDFARHFLPAA